MILKKRFLAVIGVLAIAAVLAVSLALVLEGQSSGVAETQTALATASPGGPSEGLQIHGHWVIEVRDPDGSLASRREFDNALTSDGATSIEELLAGVRTPGRWSIVLDSNIQGGGACDGQNNECTITEPFLTLSNASGDLVLRGNAVGLRTGEISVVKTHLQTCGPSIAPDACATTLLGVRFTSTTLANPVPVELGQSILAVVTLSAS